MFAGTVKLDFPVCAHRVCPFSVFGLPYLRILVFAVTVFVIFAFTAAVMRIFRFFGFWVFYCTYSFVLVAVWASLHQVEPQFVEIVHFDDRFRVCIYYPPDDILLNAVQFGLNLVSFADVEKSAIDVYKSAGTFFPNDSFWLCFGYVLLGKLWYWAPGVEYRHYLSAIESHFEFEFFAGSVQLSGSCIFPVASCLTVSSSATRFLEGFTTSANRLTLSADSDFSEFDVE